MTLLIETSPDAPMLNFPLESEPPAPVPPLLGAEDAPALACPLSFGVEIEPAKVVETT